MKTKVKVNKFLLALVLAGLGISLSFAQDTSNQSKPKADIRTITGCLSKGDGADEFMLAGNDGSTWEVHSGQMSLAGHVGHTITATGVVSNAKLHNLKEDAKDAAKDSGMTKDNSEHGHLTITEVKMVGDSCLK